MIGGPSDDAQCLFQRGAATINTSAACYDRLMLTKDLVSRVINVLNRASTDYRALSQRQTERGERENAADYHKRAEECHDLARQLDNVGMTLPE